MPATEIRLRERNDQYISPGDLDYFGVPEHCLDCPRIAFEHCQQRNEARDDTFRGVNVEHGDLTNLVTQFISPSSTVTEADVIHAAEDFVDAVTEYRSRNPFRRSFRDYISNSGTKDCDGLDTFQQPQTYERRYTRDKQGLPVPGEATAKCHIDSRYVRDSKGYATIALKPVVELRSPAWKLKAEELFLGEYGESKEERKKFYTKYAEPSYLYQELAARVLPESPREAYGMMYGAYMTDAANNNTVELDKLIEQYKEEH